MNLPVINICDDFTARTNFVYRRNYLPILTLVEHYH